MTETIASYLAADHRRCDHLLAACEEAVSAGAWEATDAAAASLRDAMLRHFGLEEDLLFPQLEQASPMSSGPAQVMRAEHRQMRQLLEDLDQAVRDRDPDACLGGLETLHLLVQQHNAKEEGILYPLSDAALGAAADALLGRMRAA